MKKLIYCIFCFLFIISISCNKKENSQSKNEEHNHWSYEGETAPEHWAEIEKNSDCGGNKQSPINIIEIDAIYDSLPENKLDFFYNEKTNITEVQNNGHSIEFDFELGDSISFKNEIYHLLQIHFHEPSEHTINGVRYPIEIHFVHKSNLDDLTVISVLGEEGEESELFEFFESFLPIQVNESKMIQEKVNVFDLLSTNDSFYNYNGSLTTPPCSENVNWVVFKKPIVISEKQVLTLQKNMPLNNYRNEQPLNGRKVFSISLND